MLKAQDVPKLQASEFEMVLLTVCPHWSIIPVPVLFGTIAECRKLAFRSAFLLQYPCATLQKRDQLKIPSNIHSRFGLFNPSLRIIHMVETWRCCVELCSSGDQMQG